MDDRSDPIEAMCAAHGPVDSAGRFTPGTIFGDWRVTAFIGRGGSGEVYCAEHATLGTPVAVKVLVRDEERAKARFEREAKLLAELKSESFPRFYGYGEANGVPYIAMELLEPGDMPSGDKAVARFMLMVCDAVAELHSHGLVHRDIKPGNILWRNGVPVLSDMGLVKSVGNASNSNPSFSIFNSQLSTSHGAGTPGYGAPEQMERGEVSFASDIHALGVLADHCFGGNPPRAWTRIIERATSSIPGRRYSSVKSFARAIRHRRLVAHSLLWLSGILLSTLAVVALREPIEQRQGPLEPRRVQLEQRPVQPESRPVQPEQRQTQPEQQPIQQREQLKVPILDASASVDGEVAYDASWFIDDCPVSMPYHFTQLPGGKQDWMPRRLCAVVRRNGKTYSAKRTDIVPKSWTGRKALSLALKEDPADGTVVRINAQDGTPFEFAWCSPQDVERAGFWIATRKLTGRQLEAVMKENTAFGGSHFRPFQYDKDSDFPVSFMFFGGNTVPTASLDGLDLRIEPPDFLQWRRGRRRYTDFYGEMPEWAGVPPSLGDDERRKGGWMRMDGSGKETYIDNFGWGDTPRVAPACVRYMAVSRFWYETNTVLYCAARSLLQSKATEDVVRGEAMMKSFFQSDDMALRLKAMEVCVERGISALDDFSGTNANKKLRFAAIRGGDARMLVERLAVGDPDPDVRKEAYERIANPSPMVSARYIAQIRAEDDPGDITKPLKVIWSMTDRDALEFLIKHSQFDGFRDESRRRLNSLGGK